MNIPFDIEEEKERMVKEWREMFVTLNCIGIWLLAKDEVITDTERMKEIREIYNKFIGRWEECQKTK